ncbi:hypothetical protein ACFY0G_32300 [Streptomyces sp. NPDC001552]|uniref:hypothetical protein n=1 Tax=Streptomyces sp. NPDC001552 TaxID=3364587 RepID=UPI0036C84F9B
MKRTFALNTEPHEAEIGDVVLRFKPEVMGDDFLDGYTRLRDAQSAMGIDTNDLANVDPETLRTVLAGTRVFLAGLMLPESAEEFARWEVVAQGHETLSYSDPAAAAEAAEKLDGAKVVDRCMRLPDRVLVQLLEWVVELYAGGSRPSTSSTASASASRRPGTPGKAVSRSRA